MVNGGVTRSLSYTPTGNTASDNHGNGTVLNYTYNEAKRVVQVANQSQALASYTYNYLGQRAQKTTPSTITQFVYDPSGHLLAESDGTSGAAQTEYIWLDDTPLVLVTSGNLYFIHPDHLGTPQKATDASQNLAWDAVLRPFGQVEQQTFPPLTNLRFPGQYFDVESALHQNWFRDYDPSIGRYIESDPIGLEGGINTYAYVGGNPTDRIDPAGEQMEPWAAFCLYNPDLCYGAGPKPTCPPCKLVDGTIVALGTIAYRPLDTPPPGDVEHGIQGPHYNIYEANQNPINCKCFWASKGAVSPADLPPGAIPIQPFAD